jgi:serine/threonine-protein phosphatase PP1 catalytic subunit
MIHVPLVDRFMFRFEKLVTADDDPLTCLGQTIPIPKFNCSDIRALLAEVTGLFQSQPCLLRISPPVTVVGDIHGNLQDLVRILRELGLDQTYLFLGDYVDRGNFSLE